MAGVEEGRRVRVRWDDGVWYQGKVTAILFRNNFRVCFDDGDVVDYDFSEVADGTVQLLNAEKSGKGAPSRKTTKITREKQLSSVVQSKKITGKPERVRKVSNSLTSIGQLEGKVDVLAALVGKVYDELTASRVQKEPLPAVPSTQILPPDRPASVGGGGADAGDEAPPGCADQLRNRLSRDLWQSLKPNATSGKARWIRVDATEAEAKDLLGGMTDVTLGYGGLDKLATLQRMFHQKEWMFNRHGTKVMYVDVDKPIRFMFGSRKQKHTDLNGVVEDVEVTQVSMRYHINWRIATISSS